MPTSLEFLETLESLDWPSETGNALIELLSLLSGKDVPHTVEASQDSPHNLKFDKLKVDQEDLRREKHFSSHSLHESFGYKADDTSQPALVVGNAPVNRLTLWVMPYSSQDMLSTRPPRRFYRAFWRSLTRRAIRDLVALSSSQ